MATFPPDRRVLYIQRPGTPVPRQCIGLSTVSQIRACGTVVACNTIQKHQPPRVVIVVAASERYELRWSLERKALHRAGSQVFACLYCGLSGAVFV